MAAMDFPNSPTVDDLFTVGETTWMWTGDTWDITSGQLPLYVLVDSPVSGEFLRYNGAVWINSSIIDGGSA